MQLRQIKEAYDYKAEVPDADKKERSVRHAAMRSVILEIRDKHLNEIREEVASFGSSNEMLDCFLYVDDLISFKIILEIISELRYLHQDIPFEKLTRLTQNQGDQDIYKDEINKSVKSFEEYLNEYHVDQIDADSLKSKIHELCGNVYSRLAYECSFDEEDIDGEFKKAVETDLVLACLEKFFGRFDKLQMDIVNGLKSFASAFSLVKAVYSLSKDAALKPFVAMRHLLDCVYPVTNTSNKWIELNRWMQGVHYYHKELLRRKLDPNSYSCGDQIIIMNDNQPYPPINETDMAIQYRLKLTFYDLAVPIYIASQVLASKLSPAVPAAEVGRVSQVGLYAASSAAAAAAAVKSDEELQAGFRPA